MSNAYVSCPCRICGRDTTVGLDSKAWAVCETCTERAWGSSGELTQTLPLEADATLPGALDSDADGSHGIEVGDVLAERFQVVRPLGRGGMGEVFEARDLVLNDHMALKVVRTHGGTSDETFRRLRQEVQLARRVTHNNICRIFDLIQHRDPDDGRVLDLVTMELLRGETLREYRRRLGRLGSERVLPIIRQVARGLNAAHRLGIVHRDLKPANVMLIRESAGLRAAITDFGLAHRMELGRLPETAPRDFETLVGTPAYMAPEQVAGEPTSPATDIYSLGVMLYEMLSGHLPFEGDSPWQSAILRLTETPTPLPERVPDLDPKIAGLVERCLRRDPAERFDSTSEILDLLDFGDLTWDVYGLKSRHLKIRRHDPGSGRKPASQQPRARRLAAGTAFAVSAVVAGLALGSYRPHVEAPAPVSEATELRHAEAPAADLDAVDLAGSLLERYETEALATGNERLAQLGRASRSLLRSQAGPVEERLQSLEEAAFWFRHYGETEGLTRVYLMSAEAWILAGRLDLADSFLDQAAELDPAGSRLLDLWTLRSRVAYEQGDGDRLAPAASLLGDPTQDAAEHGPRSVVERLRRVELDASREGRHLVRLEAALARGRLTDDRELLAKVREDAERMGLGRLSREARQALSALAS